MPVQMTQEQRDYWNDLSNNMQKHVDSFRETCEQQLAEGKKEELEKELHSLKGFIEACDSHQIDFMTVERDWAVAKVKVLKELL